MSENNIEITCPRCGHTWEQDLTGLDKKDLVVYRDPAQPKKKQYRVRCPRCGTRTIVSVEEDNGETGG